MDDDHTYYKLNECGFVFQPKQFSLDNPMLSSKEENPALLWCEIYRLRSLLTPPSGFNSWHEAATNERLRRVSAEKEINGAISAMRAYAANNPIFKHEGIDQDPNGVHAWLKRNDSV